MFLVVAFKTRFAENVPRNIFMPQVHYGVPAAAAGKSAINAGLSPIPVNFIYWDGFLRHYPFEVIENPWWFTRLPCIHPTGPNLSLFLFLQYFSNYTAIFLLLNNFYPDQTPVYSVETLLVRFRGESTSRPLARAVW